MTIRTDFPFKAWRLLPSFKPAETIVTGTWYGSSYKAGPNDTYVNTRDIFDSKQACIAGAEKRLDEQQDRIIKMQATLDKRRAVLRKAT